MLLCLVLEEGQGEKEGKGQVCMLAITLFKQKLQKSFAAQNLGGKGGGGAGRAPRVHPPKSVAVYILMLRCLLLEEGQS